MRHNDLKKGKHRADLIQALLSGRLLWKRRGDKPLVLGQKFDRSLRETFRALSKSRRGVHFAHGTLLRCFRVTIDDTRNISAKGYTSFPCTRRYESRQLSVWLTSVFIMSVSLIEADTLQNRSRLVATYYSIRYNII